VADDGSDELLRYRRVLEGLLGIHATEGNQVEVLRNGDEIFPAMLEAIVGARHTVDFLVFVYWKGSIGEEFAEALAERAEAGLRVRVLLDTLGAYSMEERLIERMEQAGCQLEWFRPVSRIARIGAANHRTHRKVLICDEEVAFTGGVGIADEWRGDARNSSEWRDTHFRVRGPAVCGLRGSFVDNWAETGRPLFEDGIDRFPLQPTPGRSTVQVVRGATETGWSDITTVVRSLLLLARRHVRITTAYFSPDHTTLDLLCSTVDRGVDVDLLLPGPHTDKRFVQLASESEYQPLLDAGVRIWAFQPSMLHAKVMTADGVIANVGSANFNSRSLSLDEEVNLVVFDPDIVGVLDDHFHADLERAEPIDPSQWSDRTLPQRAKEAVSSVFERNM
jgi:cardiolipin synthase